MRIYLGIVAFLSIVGLFPAVAEAHPMLDRAVAQYEEANFAAALRTFNTAARNADLSVEELLTLLEMRALVHHALGDSKAMRADLHRLAAVRGSHQLGKLAPPAVRDAFEEVRKEHAGDRAVELRIEQQTVEKESWMVARVLRVPDGLVDHTTLQCNVDGNVKTISATSQGMSARVKLPDSSVHSGCAATARTRQGGVLFNGMIDAPSDAGPGGFRVQPYGAAPKADTKKKKKWPWIVAAVGVAVAGGVTAGVLLSKRSSGGNGERQVGGVSVGW